ncbi:hypothetical protein ACSSS7_006219 [Eimeria intestinalis]
MNPSSFLRSSRGPPSLGYLSRGGSPRGPPLLARSLPASLVIRGGPLPGPPCPQRRHRREFRCTRCSRPPPHRYFFSSRNSSSSSSSSSSTSSGEGSSSSSSSSGSSESSRPGLLQLPGVHTPEQLLQLSRRCLRDSEFLLKAEEAREGGGGSGQEAKRTVQLLDTLSNALCKVADAAELIRNVHVSAEWRQAGAQVVQDVQQFMSVTNFSDSIYKRLKACEPICEGSGPKDSSVAKTEDEGLTLEEARVLVCMREAMEQQGLHLSPEQKAEHLLLLAKEQEAANACIVAQDDHPPGFQVSVQQLLAAGVPQGLIAMRTAELQQLEQQQQQHQEKQDEEGKTSYDPGLRREVHKLVEEGASLLLLPMLPGGCLGCCCFAAISGPSCFPSSSLSPTVSSPAAAAAATPAGAASVAAATPAGAASVAATATAGAASVSATATAGAASVAAATPASANRAAAAAAAASAAATAAAANRAAATGLFTVTGYWEGVLRTPEAVSTFLERIELALKPGLEKELNLLKRLTQCLPHRFGVGLPLQPWDFAFLMEMHAAQHAGDGVLGVLSRRLPLMTVWQMAMQMVESLTGLTLVRKRPAQGETWHWTVLKFELRSVGASRGPPRGDLYVDLWGRRDKTRLLAQFTVRGSKQMWYPVEQGWELGGPLSHACVIEDVDGLLRQIPCCALVANFNRPPSLRDATGTRGAVDFSEFPSHLFEFFAPQIYQTHAKMGLSSPREAAQLSCMQLAHQLIMALLDRAFHTFKPGEDALDSKGELHAEFLLLFYLLLPLLLLPQQLLQTDVTGLSMCLYIHPTLSAAAAAAVAVAVAVGISIVCIVGLAALCLAAAASAAASAAACRAFASYLLEGGSTDCSAAPLLRLLEGHEDPELLQQLSIQPATVPLEHFLKHAGID